MATRLTNHNLAQSVRYLESQPTAPSRPEQECKLHRSPATLRKQRLHQIQYNDLSTARVITKPIRTIRNCPLPLQRDVTTNLPRAIKICSFSSPYQKMDPTRAFGAKYREDARSKPLKIEEIR